MCHYLICIYFDKWTAHNFNLWKMPVCDTFYFSHDKYHFFSLVPEVVCNTFQFNASIANLNGTFIFCYYFFIKVIRIVFVRSNLMYQLLIFAN